MNTTQKRTKELLHERQRHCSSTSTENEIPLNKLKKLRTEPPSKVIGLVTPLISELFGLTTIPEGTLHALYSDSVAAKIWGVAERALDKDNIMNLDLLFWAATELRGLKLREMAINHARTTQKHHVRSNSSPFHVVNFDQVTGKVRAKMTNQGYSDSSGWAITGFAQTYLWTGDVSFLTTARDCADYFLAHLPPNGVPFWDFKAPVISGSPIDTSVAVVACYGMLLLHEALVSLGEKSPYLEGAMHILTSVSTTNLSAPAHFSESTIKIPSVEHETSGEVCPLEVDMGDGAETILLGATINNYEFVPRRWANHGLVYADYYFLLVGNKLLDMGIGRNIAA